MKKKSERYLCPSNQNEMLKVMATMVLRKILQEIQETEFFSLMIDECADITNKEQVRFFVYYRNIQIVLWKLFETGGNCTSMG